MRVLKKVVLVEFLRGWRVLTAGAGIGDRERNVELHGGFVNLEGVFSSGCEVLMCVLLKQMDLIVNCKI